MEKYVKFKIMAAIYNIIHTGNGDANKSLTIFCDKIVEWWLLNQPRYVTSEKKTQYENTKNQDIVESVFQ